MTNIQMQFTRDYATMLAPYFSDAATPTSIGGPNKVWIRTLGGDDVRVELFESFDLAWSEAIDRSIQYQLDNPGP